MYFKPTALCSRSRTGASYLWSRDSSNHDVTAWVIAIVIYFLAEFTRFTNCVIYLLVTRIPSASSVYQRIPWYTVIPVCVIHSRGKVRNRLYSRVFSEFNLTYICKQPFLNIGSCFHFRFWFNYYSCLGSVTRGSCLQQLHILEGPASCCLHFTCT